MDRGFQLSKIELRYADGEVVQIRPEVSADGYCGASGRCGAAVRLHKLGEIVALEAEGSVEPAAPRFGYQRPLACQDGMTLWLELSGGADSAPFVSVYQHKEWWLRPAFGDQAAQIPPKSQLVIIQEECRYRVYLAVSGKEHRADLEGTPKGLCCRISSNQANRNRIRDLVLVTAVGENPYELAERAAAYALMLTGKALRLRREKPFPDFFGQLGWCTWDSLGQKVSEQAILAKMDEFAALGVPVSWVLIDDGWSYVDQENQELKGLGADPTKFPDGLAGTVAKLKEQYKVSQVGVWQAVKGYWNGVQRGSAADRELGAFLTDYPNGDRSVQTEPWVVFGFWDRWHSRLEQEGVSFIKVDSQSSFSLMTQGTCSYGKAADAVHTGLEASADLHFGGNLINCMGMAPEDVWNRRSASISRNSDDFTPTVAGSFAEHALQNGYNSIYHGCFYWEDWDMVWSVHPEAKQNILLRVISGGPFYLSDALGRTDPEAIWPVIREDGTVLRCCDVARPTLDCLTEKGVLITRPLKLCNRCGEVWYVAAFLDRSAGAAVRDVIRLEDLCGAETRAAAEMEYLVYDFNRREGCRFDQEKGFVYEICPGGAALYQFIPVHDGFAVVGMTDKYLSRAGIAQVQAVGDSRLIWPDCSGELTIYAARPVQELICHSTDGKSYAKCIARRKGNLLMLSDIRRDLFLEVRLG